jgi:hypothetical protein
MRTTILMLTLLTAGCSEFGVSDHDEVVQDPIVLTDSFIQSPLPKLDVLWVIDDTPSMDDEQAALAEALSVFAEGLDEAGLAWQVGVVRTDISGEDAGVLQGLPWVITPALDDPALALAEAAAVGLTGQPPEAGLAAAWLALTEPLRSSLNRGLRRSDAALHVVVVSDGDDASELVLGGSPDEAFTLFLEEETIRTSQPAVLSALVGDAPDGCAGPGGSAQPGSRYIAVAEATGGVVLSICEPDFSPLVSALAQDTVPWPVLFELTERPVRGTIRVEVDGVRLDEGWTLQTTPTAIVFEQPPAAGAEIQVRYEVAT